MAKSNNQVIKDQRIEDLKRLLEIEQALDKGLCSLILVTEVFNLKD